MGRRSCENTRDRMGDTLHIRLMTLNRLGRWGRVRCDRSVRLNSQMSVRMKEDDAVNDIQADIDNSRSLLEEQGDTSLIF